MGCSEEFTNITLFLLADDPHIYDEKMIDDDDVLDAIFDVCKRLCDVEEHQMEIIRRLLSIEDKVTPNG